MRFVVSSPVVVGGSVGSGAVGSAPPTHGVAAWSVGAERSGSAYCGDQDWSDSVRSRASMTVPSMTMGVKSRRGAGGLDTGSAIDGDSASVGSSAAFQDGASPAASAGAAHVSDAGVAGPE